MGVPDRGLTWPDHRQNQGKGLIQLRVVFAPRCAPAFCACRGPIADNFKYRFYGVLIAVCLNCAEDEMAASRGKQQP
jgi:hypothetical protein